MSIETIVGTEAFKYLLKYGPKAWRALRGRRERNRRKKFIARMSELQHQADVKDDPAEARQWVWAKLTKDFPKIVGELTTSEKNRLNEVVLGVVRTGETATPPSEYVIDVTARPVGSAQNGQWRITGTVEPS
jgi:hypothetical protein